MLLVLGLLASTGCRSVTPENVIWDLVALRAAPVRTDEQGRAPTMRLDPADHRVGGTSVCNGYSGSYTLAGDSLRFGPILSTKRACVDPEMNRQETGFFAALEATRSWSTRGDTLQLHDDAGVVAQLLVR